jgi:hypothetical protein
VNVRITNITSNTQAMRIVNVVTVKEGVVDEIQSFGIFEEQLSDDVVAEAEEAFKKKAESLGYVFGDDEALLDDGYFSIANASVCISWSDV